MSARPRLNVLQLLLLSLVEVAESLLVLEHLSHFIFSLLILLARASHSERLRLRVRWVRRISGIRLANKAGPSRSIVRGGNSKGATSSVKIAMRTLALQALGHVHRCSLRQYETRAMQLASCIVLPPCQMRHGLTYAHERVVGA